jgi:hypothetical protein
MKTISKYCHNKSCQHYDMDLRCHCERAIKSNDLSMIYKCKIREQARVLNRIEAVKKSREKHRDWWNGYQRSFLGRHPNPLPVVGIPYGKLVLIKDCPYCHGKHKHRKGTSIKFSQCAQGYYEISIADTK